MAPAAHREPLRVVGREAVGPYTLLRLGRGHVEPGIPGQFFMLEAPGRLLPRPFSLCLATPGELAQARQLGVTEIVEKPEVLRHFSDALARIAGRDRPHDAT